MKAFNPLHLLFLQHIRRSGGKDMKEDELDFLGWRKESDDVVNAFQCLGRFVQGNQQTLHWVLHSDLLQYFGE